MSFATESTPLLPSTYSTHRQRTGISVVLAIPKAVLVFVLWVITSLTRLFRRTSSQPILPTAISSTSTPNSTNRETPKIREQNNTQLLFSHNSTLVVVVRSTLPSATYPTSSLKKTPSLDSISPMREKSVRFSAIIDIHEFSRIVGEPFGMVQLTKAPGVNTPRIEDQRRDSERACLTLELETPRLKSSYNPRLVDDESEYSSRSRYD